MNNYQNQLTQRRRAALWREIDRLNLRQRQGKRPDQIEFSATVVFAVLALSLLAGVGLGCWAAIQRWLP